MKDDAIDKRLLIGLMFVIALAFGMAGKSDYNEEMAQNVRYCDNVASGAWPNFKPETEC